MRLKGGVHAKQSDVISCRSPAVHRGGKRLVVKGRKRSCAGGGGGVLGGKNVFEAQEKACPRSWPGGMMTFLFGKRNVHTWGEEIGVVVPGELRGKAPESPQAACYCRAHRGGKS